MTLSPMPMDTAVESRAAFDRASRALDEMILMALVRGPLKTRALRAAVMPYSQHAVLRALARLIAIGEIVGEGLTTARIYRLVQRTSVAPLSSTIRADGVEYESVWPVPDDPRAPPTVLRDRARARRSA